MRIPTAPAVAVLLCLSSIFVAAQEQHPAPKLPFVPGRVLVRFKSSIKTDAVRAAHAEMGARAIKSFENVRGLQVVAIPATVTVPEAVARYRRDPRVLYAEPDYIFSIQAAPNDPGYSQLWGMQNIGAPAAWDRSTGSADVVVAVIDTGIDYTHEDLAANMWRNPGDCTVNGIDDDANGYVDDCYGIDAVNQDSNPMDDHSHGTHVAGTIGAAGNNGIGVVGVNWNVKMIACKFLGAEGSGPSSAALECLDYLARLKARGVNIVASNNSWGGPGVDVAVTASQSLYEAVRANMDAGILFIIAAGNGGMDRIGDDNDRMTGAAANTELPNVISVAAIAENNELTTFSNFGRHTVAIGAPGDKIRSTVPHSVVAEGYAVYRGTSMATPHVTGVAALLKAANPSLTWWEIRNLILAGGTDTPGLAKSITGKRLSASGALNCSNSVVRARLSPDTDFIGALRGSPIRLSVLNINCAAPNGEVTVTVAPTGESLVLKDDGLNGDIVAGDGIFTGAFTPVADGHYELTFPGGDVLNANALRPYISAKVSEPYRTISGTSLDMLAAEAKGVTPPFPLHFGGVTWPSVFVSPHGSVSFGAPNADPNGWPIPNPWTDNVVAAYWASIMPIPKSNQNVFWEVLGSAPNRELVIEWRDMPILTPSTFTTSETIRFQAVFFENRDEILFAYADTVFGGSSTYYDHGVYAAIGIQVVPEVGAEYSYFTPRIFDGDAILWTPTNGPLITFLDPERRHYNTPSFQMHVFGNRFEPDSRVFIERKGVLTEYPAHYDTSRDLYINLPASISTDPGIHYVHVVNPTPDGDLKSNVAELIVSHPALRVDSISPTTRPAGSGEFEVRVLGDHFLPEAYITWQWTTNIPATFISAQELRATIPANNMEPGSAHLDIAQDGWFWPMLVEITGFELVPLPATSTTSRGGSAQYTIEFRPSGNYDAPITLSCSELPAAASCSFSPATVTPNGTVTPVTLTISTKTQATASASPSFAFAGLLVLRAFVFLGIFARRRKGAALFVLAIFALILLPSCGGGAGGASTPPPPGGGGTVVQGTPSGTYNITVKGQSGTYSKATVVTLTVQ